MPFAGLEGGLRGESLEEAGVRGAAEVWAKPWYLLSESNAAQGAAGPAMSCTRGLGRTGHSVPGPKGWGWGHHRGWRVIGGEMPPWAPQGRMELHSSHHTQDLCLLWGSSVWGGEVSPALGDLHTG